MNLKELADKAKYAIWQRREAERFKSSAMRDRDDHVGATQEAMVQRDESIADDVAPIDPVINVIPPAHGENGGSANKP